VAPTARTMNPSFTSIVGRTIPPWLQVVIFGYLSVMLMTWGVEKFSERQGLLLAVVYLPAAVFFCVQATSSFGSATGR
jgi:hypothetical protein